MQRCFLGGLCGLAVFLNTSLAEDAYDAAPHFYSTAAADDPVAALAAALEQGRTTVPDDATDRELTAALLNRLGISPHSQVLVFSKTSLQRDKITPANPRALYFNDETYVGWVPGGMVEFTGLHPQLGAYFYGMDPESMARPRRLVRHANCLDCHAGGMTGHWPGLMVRSVHTDARGFPLLQAGSKLVDHTTSLDDRWGGWYVTGAHGAARHLGNSIAVEKGESVSLDREAGANRRTLEGLGITRPSEYLGQGSDLVALMVLEHQVMMQNTLTAASYEVRSAIRRMNLLQKELEQPVTETLEGSAKVVAASHAEKVLKCLLFAGEAGLPEGGVEGGAEFREAFLANRQKSAGGKSLKDFQLLNRLFKYRCSYQIYSRQWLGLPHQLREVLWQRLKEILLAKPDSLVRGYEYLGEAERQDIWQILQETHPDLTSKIPVAGTPVVPK
jgi:hypothetical protein